MKTRLIAIGCLLALGLAPLHAQTQTGTDAWFRPSAKPKDFRLATLPWNAFTIELPKDWQMVPGVDDTLMTAAEKTRNNQAAAAIVLKHMRLVEPLQVSDIDAALAGLEVDAARQRDPAGQNFEPQIKEINGRRFVFLQYTRPGLNGQDRLVVYAMPVDRTMYRLICIAPSDQMAIKYQAMFAHVASSFKPIVRTN